jgi:hypothetical protein
MIVILLSNLVERASLARPTKQVDRLWSSFAFSYSPIVKHANEIHNWAETATEVRQMLGADSPSL